MGRSGTRGSRTNLRVLVALVLLGVILAAILSRRQPSTPHPPAQTITRNGWNVLTHPIDLAQQTDLPFGDRSQWLQPWRAYLDTPPASLLRDAVGINFNVAPAYAVAAARLIAADGFKRARVEIPWGAMSFADPSQLDYLGAIQQILGALKATGIRPLILLNASQGDPGPSETFVGQLERPAAGGATSLQVDPVTARRLVPGLSGLDAPGRASPAFIVTSVSPTGQVHIARPLPIAVPAGSYAFTVLRYAPFAPPLTPTGQPDPAFQHTLSGWLQYVQAVMTEVRSVLGDDDFDVEVWNELNLRSAFLSAANYYDPVPASLQGTGSVTNQLLTATVQWIRNPANHLPDVGIGDGFANQTPFVSGETLPAGVTAIDKHPYHEVPYQFPQAQAVDNQRPVNALGQPEGQQDPTGNWQDSFIPHYLAYFPEYLLTGIQTEFLERDLSPLTTTFHGAPHGRSVASPGTSTPPQVWITETNIDLTHASALGLTRAAEWHLQAKATLRTLAAYVNKGVSALYFYALTNGSWAMVDPSSPDGGPTMRAVKTFLKAFAGPDTITTRRSLSLLAIADRGNPAQFAGDGTPAHPPLYNRDVVAFFPFQVDTHRFVVPAYVMTRNLAEVYDPSASASDVSRYDLPPETYRLTVSGLDTAGLSVTATDPLTGASVPVTARASSPSTAVIEVPLTDYPRLLTIQDG